MEDGWKNKYNYNGIRCQTCTKKAECGEKGKGSHAATDSLCWCCKLIIPEGDSYCPWANDLKPVPEWVAIPHEKDGNTTYRVIDCPLFIRG